MSNQKVMALREKLLSRLEEIVHHLLQRQAEREALQEREIELEEEAQKADISRLSDQLEEREKREIEEIDLALHKIALGTYGLCEQCQRPIEWKRLDALPAARLCRRCAKQAEQTRSLLPLPQEILTATPLPQEYQGLDGRQLRQVIQEELRSDGRIDLEELKISCRQGVVYLEGAVPNEGEHQILLHILTDVMGLTAIVDRLRIDEMIWEREDRTPSPPRPLVSEDEQLLYDLEELSEDVFEAQEEEVPYTPPDRLQPERE
ncbi:MAG: BON domain-containing protein [Nitrospinota bacterium]|nr:MAG: BON domain-containing protein [Nitrospinota bacterium]